MVDMAGNASRATWCLLWELHYHNIGMMRYFGKNDVQLDKYGANLTLAALPGQGHRRIHTNIQLILLDMMKLGGIYTEKEAVNFIIDKVSKPYNLLYINHIVAHNSAKKSTFAIIPDLHAYNFSAGKQIVNDSGVMSIAE